MKFAALLAPLGVALILASAVTAAHRRLPPKLASRIIAVALGVVLVAAVPTLWLVSIGYLTHLPVLGGRLEWCAEALGIHEPVPAVAGLPALALTVIGTVRALRALHLFRRMRVDAEGYVEIAHDDRPFAFTLPGRAGHIVMSTALVELLADDEREIVLAHEHAHARYRHDRYLLSAQLAAAVMPPVRPLVRRLHYALERWADEAAVQHCGDRRLAARTVGKVALRSVGAAAALSFAGLGVPARVAALLGEAPRSPGSLMVGAVWMALAATAALSLYQLHHLIVLIRAVCSG